MTCARQRGVCGLLAGACLFVGLLSASAADFTVTSPGFPAFFSINGSTGPTSPTLTLVPGQTYTFSVNTTPGPFGHPFFINSPGVVNNNISSGTLTYTVPTVASNYNYLCPIHLFGAQILTVAPVPPTIQILSLSVGPNIILTSTGTNNWSVLPEFNTNLTATNWFALTVQSNRFANGTNETFCGRPPGENVFIRIKSSPN